MVDVTSCPAVGASVLAHTITLYVVKGSNPDTTADVFWVSTSDVLVAVNRLMVASHWSVFVGR